MHRTALIEAIVEAEETRAYRRDRGAFWGEGLGIP
jgi:hypothetical protein